MLYLIKLLCNYEIYNKYSNIILDLINNNKELYILYKYITTLITTYKRDITYEELVIYVLTHIPEKDKEVFKTLLESIQNQSSDSVIIDDLLLDLTNKQKAYEIARLALDVSEGRKSFTDLLVLLEKVNSSTASVDPSTSLSLITDDLQELYNEREDQPGLRWRLSALNRSLGSIRKGDFGFIFARPETGKTTFLASEISYFAEQTVNPILWFNNEEQGNKVQVRVYQAACNATYTQLQSNIQHYQKKYNELTNKSIRIYDSAAITTKEVQRLCDTYEPGCIVFDQLDKIKGIEGDRDDLRLGSIYIWARELAKKYCPVIGVCQSDATGEGKRWLTMDNVANAKTAKQAEADWIIGIGKTHNEAEEHLRYLSICKNKLIGDSDTDPILRHGHLTVKINPYVARYED